MGSLLKNLAIVALVTVAIWFVARLLGYHLSLLPSLLISVALTLVLNAGSLFRRRRERVLD